jgi:hypothetical protein
MKTTVELPEELLAEAKDYAREHHVTLRELLTDGLRAELSRRAQGGPKVDFVFPTYGDPDDPWPGDLSVTELIYDSYR